jgi:hypothetical protein
MSLMIKRDFDILTTTRKAGQMYDTLYTDVLTPPISLLKLTFAAGPGFNSSLRCTAQHVWCRPTQSQAHLPSLVGRDLLLLGTVVDSQSLIISHYSMVWRTASLI